MIYQEMETTHHCLLRIISFLDIYREKYQMYSISTLIESSEKCREYWMWWQGMPSTETPVRLPTESEGGPEMPQYSRRWGFVYIHPGHDFGMEGPSHQVNMTLAKACISLGCAYGLLESELHYDLFLCFLYCHGKIAQSVERRKSHLRFYFSS